MVEEEKQDKELLLKRDGFFLFFFFFNFLAVSAEKFQVDVKTDRK